MKHRPNILKLATKISMEGLTYTGVTYKDPEYRILEPIVDDDMCSVMMHMRLEQPRTTEEIAKKCKKSVEWTGEQLEKLKVAGIIRTKEGYDGEKAGWFYPIWVPGIMEGILTNEEQCLKYPDLAACFEEYTRLRIPMLAPVLQNGKQGMMLMRVMPVQSAIENNSRTASYDEVSTLIEKAHAISVGPCSCRRSRRIIGQGCGHLEEDMCLYLNDSAMTYSRLGVHRLIDKEEAYEILKRAEDNGLVHEINQTNGFEDATAICNCCSCSCYALRISTMFNSTKSIKSNYVARIDKSNCVACGQCVENCQTNALKLGQKCSVTDSHVSDTYRSDREVPWDKKSYHTTYRTDRSDVMPSGTAPCKSACPAHISVQGYLKLASQGRYREALELIKKDNPLPAICGRICNKACETACSRNSIDSAVAIDDIKKFIAEKDMNAEDRYIPPMLNQTGKPYTEKIAVIGAGPSGISCAYYLAIKGYPVTVFEKEQVLGGMLTLGIPEFRLDKSVINSEIDVLKEMGVEFKTGITIGKDKTLDDLRAEGYKAIYLAIGAALGAPLGIPGEDLAGVYYSIDFLKKVNQGIAIEFGKKVGAKSIARVAIIGGGNVAMDAARSVVRLGHKATILYRRDRASMPALDEEIEEAISEGIEFKYLVAPVEFIGKKSVASVKLEKTELIDGKPHGTGEFEEFEVDCVITATGQKTDMTGFESVATTSRGTAITDQYGLTSAPDIFAGGDVVTGSKFAIDAISAGKEAAISIHRHVHEGQTQEYGRDHRDYKGIDIETLAVSAAGYDNTPRQVAALISDEKPTGTFKDIRGVFTEEQIAKEAARCLDCGCVVLDEDMCIGCGICTTKCKFDAIKLEKVMDNTSHGYMHTLSTAVMNAPAAGVRLIRKKVF